MLDQNELLMGMGHFFVQNFMKIAVTASHDTGDIIFQEGDPAQCFYTMISGKVNLNIKTGHHVYTISQAGEVFGWSCIVEREAYSATAVCVEPTQLLKFEKTDFQKMLEEHPKDSILFYNNILKTLGKRLLASYNYISCALPPS
jgi:CRP-like cAMP-binding protein